MPDNPALYFAPAVQFIYESNGVSMACADKL
jgi:hypothetical protein